MGYSIPPNKSPFINKFFNENKPSKSDPMLNIYSKHLQRTIDSIDFNRLPEDEQLKIMKRIKDLYYGKHQDSL